jgi:hypothetical protein
MVTTLHGGDTLTPTLSRRTGEGERAADEVPDKVGDKVPDKADGG